MFDQPDAESVAAQYDRIIDALVDKLPRVAEHLKKARADLLAFTAFPKQIWRQIWSNNPKESLNAHYRRAVRARGHFPNEQSALKTLYLVTRSLDPKGTGQTKWAVRWKPALNALAITFADRMPAAENR